MFDNLLMYMYMFCLCLNSISDYIDLIIPSFTQSCECIKYLYLN